MILGRISGRITTGDFQFEIEKETRKFEYIQVFHKVYDYVLCQVIEIIRSDKDIAKCIVIGYKDKEGRIKQIRIPFDHGAEVLLAETEFIKKIIELDDKETGAYIGKLDGKDIKVKLDLKKLLTKHVAVLAKSGAGKSYTVGVLIEEILEKKVPLLIIDPHGEYTSLKFKSNDVKKLAEYELKPKAYSVQEYGDTTLNPGIRPLQLNSNLTAHEIVALFPGKLSSSQLGILYNAVKHLPTINFTSIILELEKEENNAKWTLINNMEHLNNLGIFTDSYISYNEIVQPGKCSIVNMKGIPPDVQEIIMYKLMKDLFELRKKEKIPPFFTILEEAHNYCPERSFGETKCSRILRTVASEGRKFGLGLCVVSQRPARVDKSVLSQCTTQIILKVTNPNDLKALITSVEGITAESQNEIKNIAIGTAMVTGIVDMPLFVNIRPRRTQHGGEAADILDVDMDFLEKVEEFENDDLLPLIIPKTSIKDMMLMSDREIKEVVVTLVPGYLFLCTENNMEFNLLVEMQKGNIVVDVEAFKVKSLPSLEKLTPQEIRVLQFAFQLKEFEANDLVKSGLPLDVQNPIDRLTKMGLLVKDHKYSLSTNYIFSHLSKNACFEKVQFKKIQYSNMLDLGCKIDLIKDRLSKFTSIKDQRDCYIVKYDAVY